MKTAPRRHSRRNFLASIALCGAGAVSYTRFFEPDLLEIGRHDVPLGTAGGQPLRLLHLSDLHASDVVSLEFIAQAIQLGLNQRPDLICLTGDYITWEYDHFDRYAKVLSALSEAAPTFATLGNHDGGSWSGRSRGYPDSSLIRATLANSRIELLDNVCGSIELRGRKLNLVGVGDLWSAECNPQQAFADVKPEADGTTIVLSHNPDTKERLHPYPWDLMLSGHTHGGQFYLPGIGTPFAPVRDKRFVRGLHQWEGRWLHITKGVGNLHGVRFNCCPEISLLTLA